MTKRIAMISGADSGGQNVYVAELAKSLTRIGYDVDVFTRRDSTMLPEIANWIDGVRIVHVPAGPPARVRKEDMLSHIPDFTSFMMSFCSKQSYDLAHANFFMSGLVAVELKRACGIPFVVTFHALGKICRAHQREADDFPDDRFDIEARVVAEADRIIAECPQEEEDLIRLDNADPAPSRSYPAASTHRSSGRSASHWRAWFSVSRTTKGSFSSWVASFPARALIP
jgi:D-inositol-3-phosphate glycosyltransferase